MSKKEQGVLTIEASIVLSFCTLMILFLFSFARVYSAQNLVSHAVLQAADSIALESYLRESTRTGDEAAVVELANRLTGATSIRVENFTSLRSADLPEIALQKFSAAVAENRGEADQKLKAIGVKNGLSGLDFSESRMELGSDDVVVYLHYTIKMQFPVFGMKEIDVTKAARAKTFGDILFAVETVPQNPVMGYASGGGNYKYGTEIQISATPHYGYKFVKWTDGNTDNPRSVKVTGTARYVAVFEPDRYGITLQASPAVGGTVSGEGLYQYQTSATIKAVPKTGYHFDRWVIHKHKDNTRETVRTETASVYMDQSSSATAYFERNSYTVTVETSGASGGASFVYNRKNLKTGSVPYETNITLNAPSLNGYRFLGWKEKGKNSYFSNSRSVSVSVPAKNVTYVACYESVVKTVYFYGNNNQLIATRTVNAGSSLGSNMPANPKSIGKVFNGWSNGFSKDTTVSSDLHVYSTWRTCSNHRVGHCNQIHTITGVKLDAHSIPAKTIRCRCIVCADCGVYLRYSGGRWVKTGGRVWAGSSVEMGLAVWCYEHVGGNCDSYRARNSKGEYPVH